MAPSVSVEVIFAMDRVEARIFYRMTYTGPFDDDVEAQLFDEFERFRTVSTAAAAFRRFTFFEMFYYSPN